VSLNRVRTLASPIGGKVSMRTAAKENGATAILVSRFLEYALLKFSLVTDGVGCTRQGRGSTAVQDV